MVKTVLEELLIFLGSCGIEDFDMHTSEKKLMLHYREDFDNFYPLFNADPWVNNPKSYGAPYSFGKLAHFEYKDWIISGRITVEKK